MDQRSLFILKLAGQLIAARGYYKHASLQDVVEAVIDELEAIPKILDHPADCEGCATCHRQLIDETPQAGRTLQ
jgi:hypothetical protein